ncbi:hypothetical protein AQJ11_03030 [Streptomyces corchorusii]|uniref:Uncharacterized protein n=2 Tax=Streptomyces TaxID=1883 RepID=A0A101QM86_STRCK|nr:hypothetical protein [Streptomyces corchorusii]KUN32515.1 hypothetical protein AQJ11_03030 [Streptomyces corchorusii]
MIAAFPAEKCTVRLVSLATGEEIKPGQLIPEPYGRGQITYLGPTVTRAEGAKKGRPGRVAVVRYSSPETDWVFLPAELNARYEDLV